MESQLLALACIVIAFALGILIAVVLLLRSGRAVPAPWHEIRGHPWKL
jgi:hypothetical protein